MVNDTPETDDLARGNHVVPTEWARDLERERNELRADQINHENLSMRYMDERDEARGWAEAAWAKSDRAEKMLRIAAAKADEWRDCAEFLAKRLQYWIEREADWAADDENAMHQFLKVKEASK
jgi:hypothetical protein